MDEAGVLCHGGAFDIPAVPFQGWSILKLATAKASKAVSSMIQDAQARNTPQLYLICGKLDIIWTCVQQALWPGSVTP